MSISIFSTVSPNFLLVEATWFEGVTPRSMKELLRPAKVTEFLKSHPGALVTFN
jgi:hypothetical protein